MKNGLETETVALILQLRAIDKQRLRRQIGFIDAKTLKTIDKKISELLGL